MEMPVLTEAHRKFNSLVGRWIGEEKIHPSPFDPQGGAAIGRVHNRLALNGFAVIQDYEQERNGQVNFQGHGVFTWNGLLNQYSMHWFDSVGMPPIEYRGTFENGMMVLTNQGEQGFVRATFDFSLAGRYTFRQEVSPNGEQWFSFLEGSYIRVAE